MALWQRDFIQYIPLRGIRQNNENYKFVPEIFIVAPDIDDTNMHVDSSVQYSLTYSLNTSEGEGDGLLKWAMHRARAFNFKLSPELQAGEHLLHAEGLALHVAHKPDEVQLYIACAQISMTGNGTGFLGPSIKSVGGCQ
jgi:hypothetical protein